MVALLDFFGTLFLRGGVGVLVRGGAGLLPVVSCGGGAGEDGSLGKY